MKTEVFGDMTSCRLVMSYHSFRGTSFFHLQGSPRPPSKQRQQTLLKRPYFITNRHGVMTQKTLLFRLVFCSLISVCWMTDKKTRQTKNEGREERGHLIHAIFVLEVSPETTERRKREKRIKKNPFVPSGRSCLRNFSGTGLEELRHILS
jgi:hypothetical protein